MRGWSPAITVITAGLALLLAIVLWRRLGLWRKATAILSLVLISAAAWFARQNHFEWMFNPLPNASYVRVSGVDFLSPEDHVLAVEFNGEAAAYPVRQLAYHHLVQDQVGGVPIVATY
jgi:hypothetical protein